MTAHLPHSRGEGGAPASDDNVERNRRSDASTCVDITITLPDSEAKYLLATLQTHVRNIDKRRDRSFVPEPGHFDAALLRMARYNRIIAAVQFALASSTS